MQMVQDVVIYHRAQPMLNFVALIFKDAPDAYGLLSKIWIMCKNKGTPEERLRFDFRI